MLCGRDAEADRQNSSCQEGREREGGPGPPPLNDLNDTEGRVAPNSGGYLEAPDIEERRQLRRNPPVPPDPSLDLPEQT